MKTAQKNRSGTKEQLQSEIRSLKRQLEKFRAVEKENGEIREKYRLTEILLNTTAEGIVITDPDGVILSVNRGFTNITGFSADEVQGLKTSILRSERHEKAFYTALWRILKKKGKWKGEIWNRRKNGELYCELLSISSIKNEKGKTTEYVGVFIDISKYISDDITLRNQVYYDALTHLPSRQLLHDRLNFMLAHARRYKKLVAVLLLDVDRFKLINDMLGYASGDIVLQSVAERMKQNLREVDSIFRLGDDEFAVLLEDVKKVQNASKVARKIISILEPPLVLSEQTMYITVSIGIAMYPDDGEDGDTLLKHAETAMHRCKEQGTNNYRHYTPTMNVQAFEQLNLEYNLRKALDRHEFLIYYQPQIALGSQKVVGAEALIRWDHPELGLVSPAEFIPLAEETGLIIPVGQWVLETACAQMKLWHQLHREPLRIAINLSALQFRQKDLLSQIKSILKNTALPPEYLEIEITESVSMENAELTISILDSLKQMGVRIALDDFGTGYSSLAFLKQFPINALKIDRSFVNDISTDHNDAGIIPTVIGMAHSFDLEVVAEGVETVEQLTFLKKNRCDLVQGYLFDAPLPGDAFEKLLKKGVHEKFGDYPRIPFTSRI
jgi:diguanylate cyclase (GGDEF)-like protein/PAS domain S-box-containing protein